MRRAATALLVVISALAILSCGGSDDSESRGGSAITYTRSGGGEPATVMVIHASGRGETSREDGAGEHFRLPRADLRALRGLFDKARFTRLEDSDSGCGERCFRFQVTYRGHAVNLDERSVPPRLDDALNALALLAFHHRPQSEFDPG